MTLLSWPRLWHVLESLRNRPYFEFGRRPDLGACERIQARNVCGWDEMTWAFASDKWQKILRIIRLVCAFYRWWKDELQKLEGGIYKFADGYNLFGFTRKETGMSMNSRRAEFLSLRTFRIWKMIPSHRWFLDVFRWREFVIECQLYVHEHLKHFEELQELEWGCMLDTYYVGAVV